MYCPLFKLVPLYNCRSINGVKDMPGFRQTFNISYDRGGNESTSLCDDDLGSSVVLVSLRGASGLFMFKVYFISLYPLGIHSCYCINRMFCWGALCWR